MRFIIYPVFLCLFSINGHGELHPMSENELAFTEGQAFIGIDQYNQDGLDFTRLNLGMDIEIVMNADEIVFGEYDIPGEAQGADIDFKNYAMGYIDQHGTVRPFEMKDPFLEWVYDRSGGTDDFVGFRFGFGESKGMMSMDAHSLTGNIDVKIAGDYTYYLFDREWLPIPLTASGLSSLVDAQGNPDPVRATMIGLPNGTAFNVNNPFYNEAFPIGPEFIEVGVDNCELSLGAEPMCFALNTFESMMIGDENGDAIGGLFQSFQTRSVTWGNASAGETQVATGAGAFFNIPRGSVNITPNEARAGTPRLATEFIDRGVGRFEHVNYRNGSVEYPE